MTKRGLTIAENFAASAKTPLLTGDELTLAVLVTDAMKDPDVAYAVVADNDGKVLAQSDASARRGSISRPKDLAPLKDQLLIQTYTTNGRRIIDFAVPLIYSRVPVGALYLGFSKQSINAALAKARNEALLITCVMIAVGIGGAVGLATLLSRPIFRLMEGTRAIAAGNFHVVLQVPSRDEIGMLTESFNQMARSLREKEMIKRAFTRYVAREVVEEILKDPESMVLRGERREVTVLFCDVRGFTPLSERLSPEEVVLLLNDFYTLMIETTFKHDGTLDKFMGDAVMAIFGAPIAPSRSFGAGRSHRARHAGGDRGPQREAGPGRQGRGVDRHRGQRRGGGGGNRGHGGSHGVHGDRRQRQSRGAARVQRQAGADPHQPAHMGPGARRGGGAAARTRSRSRARRSRSRSTRSWGCRDSSGGEA